MKGVDLSMWQSVGSADWFKPDFVIIKATEGNGYTDKNCDPHYQHAKAQGKLLGVYHFARPDLGNTAVAEADWFVSQIQGYIKEAILILDWEPAGQMWNVGWAKAWLDRVYQRTGVRPLIYMSASVVNGYNWSSVANANYGLWIAGYPAEFNVKNPRTPDVSEMPYAIGAWPFWAIWQYSSSAGTLDRNVAAMDATAWKKYAGAKTTAEKPKTEDSSPKETPESSSNDPRETGTPSEKEKPEDTTSAADPDGEPGPGDGEPGEVIPTEETESTSTDTGLTTKQWQEVLEKGNATVDLLASTAKKYGLSIKMSNKVYDVLKFLVVVLLPVCATLYVGLAKIWGWGFGTEVDSTVQLIISALTALLGITIHKSSSDYNS